MKVVADAKELDALTGFFSSMPGKNERARNSALSSIGYKLKMSAKEHIKNNSLGWPKLSNLTRMTKKYEARTKTDGRGRTSSAVMARDNIVGGTVRKIWGSLADLLVYSTDAAAGLLRFGFEAGTFGTKKSHTRSDGTVVRRPNVIGQKVVDLAKALTEGFSYVIGQNPTKAPDAQRRYFAALGFIFPKGKVLKIPSRPLVGPVFQANQPSIPTWFRDKFWERLRKYV